MTIMTSYYKDAYQLYREAWDHAGQGNTPGSPIHIDIELSSVCNLKCPMCPQTVLPKDQKKFMDVDLAKRIIDEAYELGVMSVKLNWRGEATLHPQFEEIAKYCAERFLDVMLNTNGMYSIELNEVLRNCFDTVIFSIDSLFQNTLDKIRPGADNRFVIMRNVDYMMSLPSRPLIRFNHTRQKGNWHELEVIKNFCRERRIDLNSRIMFPRTDHDKDFVKEKVKIVGRKNCGYPFQRLVVGYNGSVYPCCVAWDGEMKVGDITQSSLLEIWEGVAIQNVRWGQSNLENWGCCPILKTCENCTSWDGYVAREEDGF